ncbi:uncharacterized protein N7459_005700 [Penicillium hispanicum]|uniref:uncharacterized protein n=1 Tax=Penicillium hispanicum TaxID=1080232 RepID=UPI00253FC96E|nr:uncharacterized protein N7459_005700 [Penicillium hispanicum]KAJ5579715.1 hypothetical protein N7459_005700 [Penicillium hispanicum]
MVPLETFVPLLALFGAITQGALICQSVPDEGISFFTNPVPFPSGSPFIRPTSSGSLPPNRASTTQQATRIQISPASDSQYPAGDSIPQSTNSQVKSSGFLSSGPSASTHSQRTTSPSQSRATSSTSQASPAYSSEGPSEQISRTSPSNRPLAKGTSFSNGGGTPPSSASQFSGVVSDRTSQTTKLPFPSNHASNPPSTANSVSQATGEASISGASGRATLSNKTSQTNLGFVSSTTLLRVTSLAKSSPSSSTRGSNVLATTQSSAISQGESTQTSALLTSSAARTTSRTAAASNATSTSTIKTWRDRTCNDQAANDINMASSERWAALNTSDAWYAATDWYDKLTNPLGQFSEEISSFFRGPEGLKCDNLGETDGCSGILPGCTEFNNSAGYLIVASFVEYENVRRATPSSTTSPTLTPLFQTLNGINAGIETGSVQAQQAIDPMVSTFAPTSTYAGPSKLALDIISLVLSLFMAPVWNIWLKKLDIPSNRLGTIKDQVNPIMTNSITMIKDSENDVTSMVIASQTDLTNALGNMTHGWQLAMNNTPTQYFNGSHMAQAELYNLIRDGAWITPGQSPSELEYQEIAMTAFYTYLIPEAWRDGENGPFIMDGGTDCVDGKVLYRYDNKNPVWRWFQEKAASEYGYCYNNHVYYLVNAKSAYSSVHNCGSDNWCQPTVFYGLPGADQLDGKTWGSIKWENVVNGSLNGWSQNDQRNGWSTVNVDGSDGLDTILDQGITAPGVFNIPVCSAEEAWNNWALRRSPSNYP